MANYGWISSQLVPVAFCHGAKKVLDTKQVRDKAARGNEWPNEFRILIFFFVTSLLSISFISSFEVHFLFFI